MRMFQAHNLNRVSRVRFTPDARTLTVAVRRYIGLALFDMFNGQSRVLEASIEESPSDLAYSVDGTTLAVGCHSGSVYPFRLSVQELSSPAVQLFHHVAATAIGHLRVVDEGSRFGFRRVSPVNLSGLAFSPSGQPTRARLVAVGTQLLLWNPHTQEYIVAPEEGDYRGASFGPDGLTVASIEYHVHALCVWQVKPFQVLFRTDLRGIDTFDNGSVAMMPDGERVIVAVGNVLRCVPINGGNGWDTVTKKPPLEIALHPFGRMLLVADGSKKVTAYDTGNGRPAAQYDWGIGKVGCVTYSPDGTLAAAGGEKGQVVVWDAE